MDCEWVAEKVFEMAEKKVVEWEVEWAER